MQKNLNQFEPFSSQVATLREEQGQPLQFGKPRAQDGLRVHGLIAKCPPLDPNSIYCNLLQCAHFSDTCVLVKANEDIAAFTSAYLKPGEPQVLFVWQVAVAEPWRGHGLAGRMLDALVQRPELANIQFVETTITPSNEASANLFRRFAKKMRAPLNTSILFSKAGHFAGSHDDEVLFRIGPFGSGRNSSQSL